LDDTCKQLIAETRAPANRPPRLRIWAQRRRQLFMIFAPLEGWRRVEVTDHHAAVDYALAMGPLYLVGKQYQLFVSL
jgi:hypothetical protein